MNDDISQLRGLQDQSKRLRNIKIPDEAKGLLNQLLSMQLTPAFPTPILNDQSPFVLLFSKVHSSHTLLKSVGFFNTAMIDAMASSAFRGAALFAIESTFERFVLESDIDTCIRLLQVNAKLLLENYESFDVVSSIFSISLKLIGHKADIVATTGFALTEQMISMLFERGMTKVVVKNVKIGDLTFDKPIVAVSWLLLRDFASGVEGKPLRFLRLKSIPRIVDLWDLIIASNGNFVVSEPALLSLVEGTIVPPLTQKNMTYFLSFVCNYTTPVTGAGTRLWKSIVEQPLFDLSSVFLRCAVFRKTDLAVFLSSDILRGLIERLDKECDGETREQIELTMVPKSPQLLLESKNKKLQATTTAIEFTVIFMSFCAKTLFEEGRLKTVLGETWVSFLNVLVKGIRLVNPHYSEVVFSAYAQMLGFATQCELDDASSVMVRILCSLVAKQKLIRQQLHPTETLANELLHTNKEGFGFKRKRATAYQTLVLILYQNPASLTKFYARMFLSLGMYPHARIDTSFTAKLKLEELVRLCEVLTTGTPFCISFLRDVILANQDKFSNIWPVVHPAIPSLFNAPDTRKSALELLVDVTSACFDETEIGVISKVLEVANRQERYVLINQVKSILLLNSNKIEHSWCELLVAISPSNSGSDPEILSLAFNSLHMVCTGHFQRLSEDEMQKCISVIFEFAFQSIDINISLSSLGLLWDITPFIHQLSRFWKRILSETLVFFNDSRPDVATCALKTFFSLLTSNTVQMPSDIYDHLIVSCFIPLLMTFTSFKPESWAVQQLALVLICHCACSFWDHFVNNPQFLSNFWTLLIEKQQSFLMNCQNQEINSAAFQFYEESLMCPKFSNQLKGDLLVSFTTVVAYFLNLREQKNLVMSSIGRFFFTILPKQKSLLTRQHLDIWLESIKLICSKVPAESKLTLTAQKGLESAFLLFPIENEFAHQIIKLYVDVLKETPNGTIRAVGFEYLTRIFSSHVTREDFLSFIMECKPIFGIRESTPLLKAVLDFEFMPSDDNCRVVFEIFDTIGQLRDAPLSLEANNRIVEVLPMIEPKSQLAFIANIQKDLDLLFAIWNKYCEKNASSFDRAFVDNAGSTILNYIFKHLESGDEKRVLSVLIFVQTSNCYERQVGTNKACSKWHLYTVIPFLFPLLNSPIPSVLKASRVTLLTLETELKQMIVE